MTDETRARDFIAMLAKHDFAGAFAQLDDRMKAAMPAEQLTALWGKLEQQVGTLQKIGDVKIEAVGGAHRVLVHATFEHAPIVFTLGIAGDGRIAGLFVKADELPLAPYEQPPYVDRSKFDEVDVMVGKLPGTLSLPKGASHVPAVVLVPGSGPNDRDEHIGAVAPFKDLAWGLASRGIAVLRYDKRTKVDPTGVRTEHDEFDQDAHAAVALLAARPEVDPKRVALLGHSQGGYLAPRIAADDKAIKRLVIFAGSTRGLLEAAIAQLTYFEKIHPEQHLDDQLRELEKAKAAADDPHLAPDATIDMFGAKLPGAYFLDVRGYHPADVAAKLSIPILVMQGEGDYQVTVTDDFPAWKKALAKRPHVTLRTYPGLGHAFTPAGNPPSPADYEKPGHVDAQVIADIAAFLTAP